MLRWIDEVKTVPMAPPQIRTLMISAGHSDVKPGAVAHGYREADLVLEFRDLLSAELCELGIKHMRDGDPGENLDLRDAVKVAAQCDIAVEFHMDAAGPTASGTWTLCRPHNKPLGAELCRVTADTLGIRNRGPAPEGAGQHSRLAFVSDGGGIIHELIFLTSKSDLAAYLGGKRSLAKEVARVLAEASRMP